MLLLFGLISFYFIYQKRLLKQKSELQDLELNMHRKVMAAIIDTQEIERKRLSEDIHDELGALVLALKLGNHQLITGETDEARLDRIQKNEKLIEDIANRVRDVSHNLLPAALKSGHFEEALGSLCDMLNENSSIQFELQRDEKDVQMVLKDRISMYRVINEWLTNVVKHSSSSTLSINIYKTGVNYCIDICDDGSRFNFEQARIANKGLGLMNIEGRLKQMNAGFNFSSNKSGGTDLLIRYPIKMNLL